MKIKNIDKKMSRLGLGCWAIGGGPAWGGDKDEKTCIDTIQACPQMGVSIIDTAPGYNFGKSERIIGKALKGMSREEVLLITKFGLVWEREGSPFNKVGDIQLYRNVSKESVLEEVDKSLERLGVEYIDVYMSHWQAIPPLDTPIGETMEALNELKEKGKIRAIGAANITPEQIEEYLKYGDLDIVQAKYSVLDREVEKEVLPICREKGIILQAYSPLEQGLLSGSIGRDYIPKGAQCNKKWFQKDRMPKVMDFIDELKTSLALKYECSIGDLAMAWVLAQDENITLLSGTTSKEHLQANLKAVSIAEKLERTDLAQMREMAQICEKD